MFRSLDFGRWMWCSGLLVVALVGCRTTAPVDRAAGARELFEKTVREFHLPSAAADGAARDELLMRAADGYRAVLRQYRDQAYWCAQATRSLGNVRVEQDRLNEAVALYRRVGDRYPAFTWEVLQAWKSAADLLWEAGRHEEARGYYRRIIERFGEDPDEQPPVYRAIVKAAKSRA